MELDIFSDPLRHATFLNSLDPTLRVIIQETHDHRSFLKQVQQEVFRPAIPKSTAPSTSIVESEAGSQSGSESDESESESESDESDPESRRKSKPLPAPAASLKRRPKPSLTKAQKRQITKANKQKLAASQTVGVRVKTELLGESESPRRTPSRVSGPKKRHHNCPHCAHLTLKHQCVRIISVKPRNCRHLIGAALTCAPVGDRLPPKRPVISLLILLFVHLAEYSTVPAAKIQRQSLWTCDRSEILSSVQ
jgi:hypothetical protein